MTTLKLNSPVSKVFWLECAVSFLISAVFLIFSGSDAAGAALLGGMLFALPQLYFGHKAFAVSGARQIDRVLSNFYKGESGKILLIAAGFALVHRFGLAKSQLFALYSTFVMVLLLNAFLPGLLMRRASTLRVHPR